MGIASVIEKLASVAADHRARRSETPSPGTVGAQAIQPIATYPATYPNLTHSSGMKLSPDRIASRASSQLHAYARTAVCPNNSAHIYKGPEQKLAELSEQASNECSTRRYDKIGRSKTYRKLSRPILPPSAATILRHCRCMDCRGFSEVAGQSYCAEGIGGTKVVWATGERFCSPTPDQWHYCARYDGPQISKDVWIWPRPA